MQKLILSSILCLALLGCDGFILGKKSSNSKTGNHRLTGEVCYSDESFCLPQIDALTAIDPNGDYEYPSPVGPQYERPIYLIDLVNQNLQRQISNNFKAIDYISSQKGPYAVLTRVLVNAMQELRDELGKPVFINSGYRSPGYNKSIPGSSKISRHTYGDAVDFYASDTSFEELQELCESQGAAFTLVYESHIHCDWRASRLDTAFYPPTIDPSHIRKLAYHEITGGHIEYRTIGNQVELYVADFFTEEPGDFVYEWYITGPNGQSFESTQSSIRLNPMPGTYRISVQVGNSVQLNEILEW